jgi:hypothetical protein
MSSIAIAEEQREVTDSGGAPGFVKGARPKRAGVMTSRPFTRVVASLSKYCTAVNKEKNSSGTLVALDGIALV